MWYNRCKAWDSQLTKGPIRKLKIACQLLKTRSCSQLRHLPYLNIHMVKIFLTLAYTTTNKWLHNYIKWFSDSSQMTGLTKTTQNWGTVLWTLVLLNCFSVIKQICVTRLQKKKKSTRRDPQRKHCKSSYSILWYNVCLFRCASILRRAMRTQTNQFRV